MEQLELPIETTGSEIPMLSLPKGCAPKQIKYNTIGRLIVPVADFLICASMRIGVSGTLMALNNRRGLSLLQTIGLKYTLLLLRQNRG